MGCSVCFYLQILDSKNLCKNIFAVYNKLPFVNNSLSKCNSSYVVGFCSVIALELRNSTLTVHLLLDLISFIKLHT